MTDAGQGVRCVAVLAVLALAGCSSGSTSSEPTAGPPTSLAPSPSALQAERAVVRFGASVLSVEIADEPSERTRGLMYRRTLGRDEGMLFVYPSRVQQDFWMRNTLIPLSIAFLRWDGTRRLEVLFIQDMDPCREPDADDCPTYGPPGTYDAALEVNQGWFDDADIREGAEALYEPGT